VVKTAFTALSQASFLKPIAIFFGSILPWIIVIWFLVKISRIKSFKLRFYYFAVASLGSIIARGIITRAIHTFYYFPRPFELFEMSPIIPRALTSSLPSGHMAFLIPIVLTFVLMRKKQGYVALTLVVLAGFARVIAGLHWPTDILAGLIVGAIGFLVAKLLIPKKLSADLPENIEIDEIGHLV
jgi:undecaprenyl-diphosphatase